MEPPVGPGAVAHGGLHQEPGGLLPERIETLGDEVSGAGVGRRAGKEAARHVPLPDRKKRAGADDAVADLQGARVGKTETERNAARLDDLVERVGHRAVDAPAEPPGGGIRGDIADRIEEPLGSLQVKPHGPPGIVTDDLSVGRPPVPSQPSGFDANFQSHSSADISAPKTRAKSLRIPGASAATATRTSTLMRKP